MDKYQEYYEAFNYEKRPLNTRQSIFLKGASDYSTLRYLQKRTDILLPQVICEALRHSVEVGVAPEISTVWAGLRSLVLWNYANNTISEIEFPSPVTHFLVFKPVPNVFTSMISECALIVTRDQITIYGVGAEERELVVTGLVTSTIDKVASISECKGCIFLGFANGSVCRLVYKSTSVPFLRTLYLKDLDNSSFSFLFPAFFKLKKPCPIVKIVCGEHWLLVLTDREIRIYSIRCGRDHKEKEMSTDVRYVSMELVEESESDLFFLLRQAKRHKRLLQPQPGA